MKNLYGRVCSRAPRAVVLAAVLATGVLVPARSASAQTLTAPTLMVGSVTSSSVNLAWTAVNGVTAYSLDTSTSANFSTGTTTSNHGTLTSCVKSGLLAGTTYYFRVRASSLSATGPYSATRSATTSGTAMPTATPVPPVVAPSGLSVNAASTTVNQLGVAWPAVTGAARYKAECSTSSSFPLPLTAPCSASISNTSPNVVFPGMPYGATIYVKAAAVSSTGVQSAWSAALTATIPTGINNASLPVPTGLRTVTSGGVLQVSWTALSGYTYRVSLMTDATANVISQQYNVNTSYYNQSQGIAGTQMTHRVQACNSTGCGPYSAPITGIR